MTSSAFLIVVVPALFAYVIGGIPFGYLFVRFSLGADVRTMGSGNIGATNVHRTAGRKAGLAVLLLDIVKGFVAVWLAARTSGNDPNAVALAWAAVLLGHCFPLFLRFKGGKAVAAFVGAAIYVAPLPLLVTTVAFVLTVALSKYISLGSIAGAFVFPLSYWILVRPPAPLLVAALFAAVLIVYRHKGNIERLRLGTENVFSLKGGAAR